MKHPTAEQWTAYLYDEDNQQERRELRLHLEGCQECRDHVAQMESTMKRLDGWKLATPRGFAWAPVFRWSAAAGILLALGFFCGRLLSPMNAKAMRASLVPELKEQLGREYQDRLETALGETRRQLIEDFRAARKADREEMIAVLRGMEERRIADNGNLRKDLETVAVVADERLQRTRRELGNLAVLTQTGLNETQP
jgi:hypothetical protein